MFKKSVDSIVSSLNKNVADLLSFADSQRSEAQKEQQKADELQDSVVMRLKEVDRAEAVAGKISALLS